MTGHAELDLTVTVVTRNRASVLGHCLRALVDQSLDPSRYEIIIVGAETRRRLDGEFPFEGLGAVPLRHLEHPVSVFRLTLPSAPVPASTAAT